MERRKGWSLVEFILYLLITVSVETAFLTHWTSSLSHSAVGTPESFVAAIERQMARVHQKKQHRGKKK